ncbi:MAG TPA: MoxR family ATPase [Actinomycetota bacterium]|nr:MoxR family ATPase [Actinomycetota bacterium]
MSGDSSRALSTVRDEMRKAVVGQENVVRGMLVALVARGHVMLQGVPGVAKTLMAKALAKSLDLGFKRVQFTPDLMPSDVTGNVILQPDRTDFRFRPGPVFTNVFLADEINRTPPKTQAALLEAMEERQVSVEGASHHLPKPFMVIATQNPVEYEGTYPLPEAQLDRFILQLVVNYPRAEEERKILRIHDAGIDPHDLESLGVRPVGDAADVDTAAEGSKNVTVSDEVISYIQRLAAETRSSPSTSLGVSPRGAAMMLAVCKAAVWLDGRDFVTPDDVKEWMKPTWRHRIMLRPEVEMEGGRTDAVLDGIAERVDVPG